MMSSLWRCTRAAVVVLAAAGLSACADETPMGPGAGLAVTAISPPTGSTTGSTPVTITGRAFAAGATVTIGGVAATNVNVQSATTITATTGARNAGAGDVVVVSGGQASLANAYTYVAPSGGNQPPSVSSIRSTGSRANQPSAFGDLGETLTLIASVSDNETAAAALTFEWSGQGTFGSPGATTTWTLPATLPTTPTPLTASLRVTETFTEGGITHRNTTTSNFVVQVHDSQKEILDAGVDFLTLWSNSSNSTDAVLHGFSTTCDGGRGRSGEANDTNNAHAQFVQDFPRFTIARLPPVTFNFGGACGVPSSPPRSQPNVDACSAYQVHWEVTIISGARTGARDITEGIDYVSAALENNVWKLCHSDFVGSTRSALLPFGREPSGTAQLGPSGRQAMRDVISFAIPRPLPPARLVNF